MGQKLKGANSFGGGGASSPSNTMSLGSKPISTSSGILIHPAIWTQQIWTENWGLCTFVGGAPGSPSNTMWPGPRPTCMPSFVLIHPTVWPQYTNITDRTGQTDRQTTERYDRANSFTNGRPKMTTFIKVTKNLTNNNNVNHYEADKLSSAAELEMLMVNRWQ